MKNSLLRSVFTLLVAVAAMSSSALAQDDATVESVIEMHIKSIGDVETLKAVKSMITESTMTVSTPMGDMEVGMSRFQAGNKFKMVQTIPNMGEVTMGSNGDVFWSMNPFQGAQVFEGEELATMKANAPKLFEELTWGDYDGEITLEGTEEVGGKAAYKLTFAPTEGQSTERYIDKESGQLVKMVTEAGEVLLSDYKVVEGITLPHKQTVMAPQGEVEMVVDSIKINSELPADTFALPEDVQDLIDDE